MKFSILTKSIVFTFLLLMTLLACEQKTQRDCSENITCTENLVHLTVKIHNGKEKIKLDNYYTIHLASGDTIPMKASAHEEKMRFKAGRYPFVSDSQLKLFTSFKEAFLFVGEINGETVFKEKYMVNSDCCHVLDFEGKKEIIVSEEEVKLQSNKNIEGSCTENLIAFFNENKKPSELPCNINAYDSIVRDYPLNYIRKNQPDLLSKAFKNGANPNVEYKRPRGLTPFLKFLFEEENPNLKHVQLFIDHGADINYTYANGSTPFSVAVNRNNTALMELLIENDLELNPNQTERRLSITPMQAALHNGNIEILELLLKNGANPNTKYTEEAGDCAPCPFGITPLHTILAFDYVLQKKNEKRAFIDLLLKYKANINAVGNYEGETPLMQMAYHSRDTVLAKYLIDKGAKIEIGKHSALLKSVLFSNVPMTQFLLNQGANPNFTTDNGSNALQKMMSCCGDGFGDNIKDKDRVEIAKLLISKGANINYKAPNSENYVLTFLESGKQYFRPQVTEFMIEQGYFNWEDVEIKIPSKVNIPMQVVAEGGLFLRKYPSITAPKVTKVDDSTKIVASYKLDRQRMINNREGAWRYVKYKDKAGYMFDAYLNEIH